MKSGRYNFVKVPVKFAQRLDISGLQAHVTVTLSAVEFSLVNQFSDVRPPSTSNRIRRTGVWDYPAPARHSRLPEHQQVVYNQTPFFLA